MLSDARLEGLLGSVKTTLAQMTAQGGRDVEKDLFGNPGGYATLLSSKALNWPCPKCGGGLVRQAYLGGNVYFCPSCQPQ
jgi:formamidopyrimidine-DNA glycosylase